MFLQAWPRWSTVFVMFALILSLYSWMARVELIRGQDDIAKDTYNAMSKLYTGIISPHPIYSFLADGLRRYGVMREQSWFYEHEVAKYRKRYGRDPPPKFVEWYLFARNRQCLIVDEFDRIYRDLQPMWGVSPKVLRDRIRALDLPNSQIGLIKIRSGKASVYSANGHDLRLQALKEMMEGFVSELPDLDLPINLSDEPIVVLPYEKDARLRKEEINSRHFLTVAANFSEIDWDHTGSRGFSEHSDSSSKYVQEVFQSYNSDENEFDEMDEDEDEVMRKTKRQLVPIDAIDETSINSLSLKGKPYWKFARAGCPPDSPAHTSELLNQPPLYPDYSSVREFAKKTFISDFESSTDICSQPDLKNLHSMMISSKSDYAFNELLPIFSPFKLNVNQDLVIPSPLDWISNEYANVPIKDRSWYEKSDKVYYRDDSDDISVMDALSFRYQRERFMFFANSSFVQALPIYYQSHNRELNSMVVVSPFAEGHFDAGLVQIHGQLDALFSHIDHTEPENMFANKFVVSIDGEMASPLSSSNNIMSILASKSALIRATIFQRWYDERLIPWHHYIPLNIRYTDMYSTLVFLFGMKSLEAEPHLEIGRRIADNGRSFANIALRKKDMEVYLYRLLIEYARVLDDNRDSIGYVGSGANVIA